MTLMKQTSLGLGNSTKRTRKRKREFLAEMERVVPWSAWVELVAPFSPDGRRGRPPFSVQAMLRIHFMQQWFTLSHPRWKRRCTPCRCCGSSQAWAAGATGYPTSRPSCGFAIC